MTAEHELDLLVDQLKSGLDRDPSSSIIENYSRAKNDHKSNLTRARRSPSEEARFNRDQWYAMGDENNNNTCLVSNNQNGLRSNSQPRPLTPILKRRDNVGQLSPSSEHSDSGRKSRKTLNFSLDSDQSRVSGYETDYRSASPRPRSVSPFQRNDAVSKSDYYRHKDASHNKPLPGSNQFMGLNWQDRADDNQYHSHQRPRPDLHGLGSGRNSPNPNNRDVFGSGNALNRFGCDQNDFSQSNQRPSDSCQFSPSHQQPERPSSANSWNDRIGTSSPRFGGSQQDLRQIPSNDSDEGLGASRDKFGGSCQDIDGKGRFTNLPSNWEKSISFFEQKKEQLPAQRIKSVEPLNAYVHREPIKMTESTPNLVARLAEDARQSKNDIPPWMHQLKHIVIEQMPLPAPPRFGTLLHGRRNPDWAMAAPINGPPCHLCHQPITESRCIRSKEHNFHCWHFVCSFCNKNLPEFDFTMAPDNRPYCLNCFKRYFP